jgi:hypothetical protein
MGDQERDQKEFRAIKNETYGIENIHWLHKAAEPAAAQF